MGGLLAPPETPAAGSTLLSLCSPFVAAALPYFQHVLNHYLSRAYAAALAWQGATDTAQACVTTLVVDPAPFLGTVQRKLPLLALYPVDGRAGERTLHRSKNDRRYRLVYVLRGDMNLDQFERIAPMLEAAVDLLTLATDEGGLDHHQGGARVWEDAGASRVAVGAWEVGAFSPGDNLAGFFPALQADVHVEMVERWDSASALPLWSQQLTLSAADPLGSGEDAQVLQLQSENET